MKSLIKVISPFAVLIAIVSCSGKSQVQHEDSIDIVDSIAEAKNAKQARLDSIRQDSINNASAGLTFQTVCYPENVEGIALQTFYSPSILEKNLKSIGFELIETKKEYQLDHYGENYEEIPIKIFSKTVGNRTTRVSFDNWSENIVKLEIYFPNEKDVEEFKSTVKGKLHDDRVYYWSHKITYSGTKVTIEADGAD